MTLTSRDGQDTPPMSAVSGCAAVGDGCGVERFDVEVEAEGEGDADGEPEEADGDGEALESDDVFSTAEVMISAPRTKNTAAMMTLGNCIAFLPGPRGDTTRAAGDPRSFLT
ncbi:hypothetical protein [Actinomadura fibrosa]|uniref:DUF397 domain-containing protein n=1 Tax=Actinomadura fibrosa TaxID=111802 RepID=A0ABW2XRK0_9ACTN|nr:hypothetical protein [Actinomadura fibrosa]